MNVYITENNWILVSNWPLATPQVRLVVSTLIYCSEASGSILWSGLHFNMSDIMYQWISFLWKKFITILALLCLIIWIIVVFIL